MPKFRKFKMSFNPSENDYNILKTELMDVLAASDLNSNFVGTQSRSFAESIEIVTQARLSVNPSSTIKNAVKLDGYKEKQSEYLRKEFLKNSKNIGKDEALEAVTRVIDSIENIYGKAACYNEGKEENLAKEYERKSNRDAAGFGLLKIIKDGRSISIDNLSSEVAKHFSKEAINITMNDIIGYLKNEFEVVITDKQANFLRSSWNQASLQGLTESMILPSVKYDQDSELLRSDNDSREQSFIFSGSQLEKIQMKQNIILYDNNTIEQLQTAELKVEIDISNLKEDASRKGSDASTVEISDRGSDISSEVSNLDEMGFLPNINCQPRRITVEFKSQDGLTCTIVPEVLDPLVSYADFKGKITSKNRFKELIFNNIPYLSSIKSKKENIVDTSIENLEPKLKAKKYIER
jgi:hypothetical protein